MKKLVLSLVTLTFAFSLMAKDISIGFVLVGPSTDGGWSMRHHQGFHSLSKHGYNVAKYLPYGPINEVMPYLIRRLNENSSISSQTNRELQLIKSEIRRRNIN